MPHIAYIGLGSNLGDSREEVLSAIHAISELPKTKLLSQSSFYQTEPIEAFGNDFINAVISIETELNPEALLIKLQEIEQKAKRERPYKNAPRTLDLDILLYDDLTIKSESLEVPHPRLTQRAFALVPLLEMNPSITIAGKGLAKDYLEGVQNQRILKLSQK